MSNRVHFGSKHVSKSGKTRVGRGSGHDARTSGLSTLDRPTARVGPVVETLDQKPTHSANVETVSIEIFLRNRAGQLS